MKRRERCGECGAPLLVSSEFEWRDNGVISLKKSPHNRVALFESRIIDNLFKGIEELIGMSVEHIVIESRRREVKRYIEKHFPAWMIKPLVAVNENLGEVPVVEHVVRMIRNPIGRSITRKVLDVGRVYGYGDVIMGPLWRNGDIHPWRVNIIRNPHSVLFFAAEALASVEAFEGRDRWISYENRGEDTYEYTAYPAEHPVELKDWLKRRRYDFKPGEVIFERCQQCGIPLEVARLDWDLEEGTIHDPESGRRMAIIGPFSMDSVLYDLEAELGPSIPEVVVEAQRRYVKSRIEGGYWRHGRTTFSRLAAIRGVGNITVFEVDEKQLHVHIENSCMPLLVLGMAQAIYETALGADGSTFEWRLDDDGDFEFTITLRG
ncbi:MAG: hypothetical protein AB1384_08380 [Actinomycetota bacterium]